MGIPSENNILKSLFLKHYDIKSVARTSFKHYKLDVTFFDEAADRG